MLTVADEAGATLALDGDRAQLPAAGGGGVFEIASALAPHRRRRIERIQQTTEQDREAAVRDRWRSAPSSP